MIAQWLECEKCGKQFADDEMGSKRECVTTDPPMYEDYGCCPKCGCQDMHEVSRCDVCGAFWNPDEMDCCPGEECK